MTPVSTGTLAAAIAVSLLLEAFFALSEVALISSSRARLRAQADAGSGAAAGALRMLERPERVLATALIGSNVCVVIASFATNEVAARLLGEARSAWAIVFLAPAVLVCAEILPKAVARRSSERLATIVAYPFRAAMAILSPVAAAAGAVSKAIVGLFSRPTERHPFVTREEFRAILRAERRAALDPHEAALIGRLLGMAGARVREVMTPLPDVVAVPFTATLKEVVEVFREHGYSRLPVYQDRTDNIVGILHTMDLIQERSSGDSLQALMRRPFYAPEAGRLRELLDEFRRRGHEMAIVVDEYGAATGIVTLEDVLEEMIGDILDEFDLPHRDPLEALADGGRAAEGGIQLSDLSEALGVAFPREGFDTLAGFLAHRLQRVPKVGDAVDHAGFRLTVMEATERRVRRVRIDARPQEQEAAQPGTPS